MLRSLWVCIAAGLPFQRVAHLLLVSAQMLSLPLRDPPRSDTCLLPVSQMRKGLEKHTTSLSVEDTADALPHVPWTYLSSPASVLLIPTPLPPSLPLLAPLPTPPLSVRALLQPCGTIEVCSAPAGAPDEGGREVSCPPRESSSKSGGWGLCPRHLLSRGGF